MLPNAAPDALRPLPPRAIAVLIGSLVVLTGGSIASGLTLDFDRDANGQTIEPGQILDDEYAADGVTISAENDKKAFDLAAAYHADDPDGRDPDLHQPGRGNVLIIQENPAGVDTGVAAHPDDEQHGGHLQLNFSQTFNSLSMYVLDFDDHDTDYLELYLGDTLQQSFALPSLNDGEMAFVDFNQVATFDAFRVEMSGSGAIDDVTVGHAVIPEPITAGLSLLALTGVGMAATRRRRG